MIRTMMAYARAVPFVAKKYLRGFDVNPAPWFGEEATALFLDLIKRSKVYLEYGSGGSTVAASKFAGIVVSVESDPVFLEAVRKITGPRAHFIDPKIGLTREFGFPVNANPTRARVEKWKRYPRAPWDFFRARGLIPEVILIDGRFRAACCLETILNVGRDSKILFDDYDSRDYRIVERYADITSKHGRMAELQRKEKIDLPDLKHTLEGQYSIPL